MRPLQACEPARITLLDGKERKFLLTRGGLRRLKEKLSMKEDADLLKMDAETGLIPFMIECQVGEKDLTEENLPDLLPVHVEWQGQAFAAILGFHIPNGPQAEPTASPLTQ